jgi:anaerobic ribonucleoside-triphosphate reductase activating protein
VAKPPFQHHAVKGCVFIRYFTEQRFEVCEQSKRIVPKDTVGSQRSLRVAEFIDRSDIYGPGHRSVVWVQGCTLACEGCWNTEMWAHAGAEMMNVNNLHKRLLSIENVAGVTFLGGEPLQQSPALLDLIQLQSEAGRSVMLYSGYDKDELNEVQQACVDLCDVVILGRYRQELRNTSLRWRGSTNQVIESPTGRFEVSEDHDGFQEVEMHIDAQGTFRMVGYPDEDLIEALLDTVVESLEGTEPNFT